MGLKKTSPKKEKKNIDNSFCHVFQRAHKIKRMLTDDIVKSQ